MTREEVAEQERNAVYPKLLRVANFAVALSGALFLLATGLMLFGSLRVRKFALLA